MVANHILVQTHLATGGLWGGAEGAIIPCVKKVMSWMLMWWIQHD